MTTVDERSTRPQRMLVYFAVAIVLGGLLGAGYVFSRSARADAGAVCAHADAALVRAANDSAGPGLRLVRSPDAVARAIRVYCPEKAR
ncbi:hypothetical protein [Amycolatopsis kentuckyensis]|uniref:hypothetical protein n=1 Tax=Amycolatopsis kentuckyensis TaxID=218823 RepID=UPI000A3D0120|nr:hypothetical protein [Amycolatopsis kentuckyensis]